MKKLLASTALMLGALCAIALAGPSGTIQYSVAVCDPNSPFRCAAPDASGALPITGSISSVTSEKSTALAPTYVEGTTNPLSGDLSGNLRVVVGGTLPAFASTPTFNLGNALPAGSNTIGAISNASFLSPVNGVATNPTSTLTRPANTTAYAANQLIASNVTAGSIVVPSFAIANAAGGAIIPRVRITTNATTGWGTTLTLTLWSAAPTYTNGDGGTYAVATGGANRLAQFSCPLTQYGDAASGECQITVNNFAVVKLASGTSVFWDLQATAAATPISGQTFNVAAEVLN